MLQAAGLPIREFPQTVGNTTRMGQVLFDLLTAESCNSIRRRIYDSRRFQPWGLRHLEASGSARIKRQRRSTRLSRSRWHALRLLTGPCRFASCPIQTPVKLNDADSIEQYSRSPQHVAVHPAAIGAELLSALRCRRSITERISARLKATLFRR